MLSKKSPLQKALNQQEHLLKNWKKDYFNNGSVEEITYVKDEMKIVFQEDLREHIVNLKILHPFKRYIKVEYRQCLYCSEDLICRELSAALKTLKDLNNIEIEEISIYFNFLKKNKLV